MSMDRLVKLKPSSADFGSGIPKNVCLDEFTPTQISLMLNGASTVDVDAIQKTSRYTGGFDASSSVVEIFWQVFPV